MITELYDYVECLNCEASIVLLPFGIEPPCFVDEDSLTCQDMADIEDGKPLLFDEGRHKRHVCREEQKEG